MAGGFSQMDPNAPSTAIDDSKFMRQGHTDGPYGNDPKVQAKGEFGVQEKDIRP